MFNGKNFKIMFKNNNGRTSIIVQKRRLVEKKSWTKINVMCNINLPKLRPAWHWIFNRPAGKNSNLNCTSPAGFPLLEISNQSWVGSVCVKKGNNENRRPPIKSSDPTSSSKQENTQGWPQSFFPIQNSTSSSLKKGFVPPLFTVRVRRFNFFPIVYLQ